VSATTISAASPDGTLAGAAWPPLRIAVAGSETALKEQLVRGIDQALRALGYTVAQSAAGHATHAADLGFPLGERQTVETTEWLLGAVICADAEAALGGPDILLIRDTCLDPLAHLNTAARAGTCVVTRERWQPVADAATAYAAGYDLVLVVASEGTHLTSIDDHHAAVAVELQGLIEACRVPHAEVDAEPASVHVAVQYAVAQRRPGHTVNSADTRADA
jgi:hypothetical protein